MSVRGKREEGWVHRDRKECDRHDHLEAIRDNLAARIAEAEREGWLGEVEGLQVSLAAAEDKLAQIDKRSRTAPVALGNPTLPANS